MEVSQLKSQRTNIRYFILLMLFIVTTMNYVDRATLSMAAPAMRKDLGMDAVAMGYAFSAFGWSYTALQIPGGWLLDKFAARMVYGIGLFLWSLFTFFQGMAGFIAGNIASIVTPIAIGYILNVTQSFNGALFFVGAMGLLGALSYLFIVGDIKRVELAIPEEQSKTASM